MAGQRNGQGHRRRLVPLIACISSLLAGWLAPPVFSADATLEYQVKAAFLLNFSKFVRWPPNAFTDGSAPLSICILGKDPFGRALDDVIEGESVGGRKLVVRRITQAPAPQTCQILFLSEGTKDIPRLLGGLSQGVLTVAESETFVRDGGMIGFVIDSHRVRFDINQNAAGHAGLQLSSQLLAVARSVR